MPFIVSLRSSVAATATTAAIAAATTSSAHGGLVDSFVVGSGAQSSFVQIQFANENAYLYEIRYDVAGTGRDLFDAIAAAQPGFFSFETIDFSFGTALVGITIGEDTNSGFGTPPAYLDYWHYWTRGNASEAWNESWIGFGSRTIANGSWDGWVFDSASEPAPVPAPGAVLLLPLAVVATRARLRSRY